MIRPISFFLSISAGGKPGSVSSRGQLVCLALLALSMVPLGLGFGAIRRMDAPHQILHHHHHHQKHRSVSFQAKLSPVSNLHTSLGSNSNPDNNSDAATGSDNNNALELSKNNPEAGASAEVDSFDGQGFANYLLPYALALIGSLLATAALFKFVLLDY